MEVLIAVFDADDLVLLKGDAFVDGHVASGFLFGHFGWGGFGSLSVNDEREAMDHRREFGLGDVDHVFVIDIEDMGAGDGRDEFGSVGAANLDLERFAVLLDDDGVADFELDVVDGVVAIELFP